MLRLTKGCISLKCLYYIIFAYAPRSPFESFDIHSMGTIPNEESSVGIGKRHEARAWIALPRHVHAGDGNATAESLYYEPSLFSAQLYTFVRT